ncbi:MAG: TolC family protein [Bacteriovoracaceae bacterium]|jgi:outer membrane protein TolC|nr:TolC family protein [Bacteriovoracaceae bacterium]
MYILLALISSLAYSNTYRLKPDKKPNDEIIVPNESIIIDLNDAIEMGLRKNAAQKNREYTKEINELNKEDNFASFWLPQLKLTVNSGEENVGTVYESQSGASTINKTPNGYFGLELADYTVFNWGKDYLDYLNNKNTYKRIQESLGEQRRLLRLNIIESYFNLASKTQIVKNAKRKLRHSSFVYKLAKEKVNIRKIRRSEFFQAKANFLKAHSEYQEAQYHRSKANKEFADLISDNPSSTYKTTSTLKYSPIIVKSFETLKFADRANPQIKQAKFQMENAKRSYRKVLKENMPLPKLALNFAAYKHNFSENGSSNDFENDVGNRNVELKASINMSWTIFGSGGLFNSRVRKKAFLNQKISEVNFSEAKRSVSVTVKNLHSQIKYIEKQIEALEQGQKNMIKAFNKSLDDYIDGKIKFTNFKDILDENILNTESLVNAKQSHLSLKLDLAYAMGKDDLPGSNFEGLVQR